MNWLKAALSSTIGRKIVMALTGLLLCVFLLFHLAGNLLLFVGPEAYNAYAHALHSQPALIMVAETGLFVLFVLHLMMALSTDRENREARPKDYAAKKTKIIDRIIPSEFAPENWMFATGAIVLLFLIVHLSDFSLGFSLSAQTEGKSSFDKAVIILRDPLRMVIYIVGPLILGWHLAHGVRSSFQTLGLDHPKYNGIFVWGGRLFSAFVGFGFASFVIWASAISHDPEAAKPVEHEKHSKVESSEIETTEVKIETIQ